jgi:hypothetical protein
MAAERPGVSFIYYHAEDLGPWLDRLMGAVALFLTETYQHHPACIRHRRVLLLW